MLSIESLRPAFEFSPRPCMILKNDSPSYTIAYVNRAFIKAVEIFKDTMMGMSLFEAFPQKETDKAFILHQLASRMTNEYVYPIIGKNKNVDYFIYTPFDLKEFLAHSQMIKKNAAIHGVFKQVTATDEMFENNDILERVSNAFFRNEQRFKSLVQEGEDMIAIADTNGRCSYVSPTVEKVLQLPADYFMGKNVLSFIHREDRRRVYQEFSMIRQKKRVFISPYRFADKDHQQRWIESVVTDMFDEPTVAGIVINSREITKRIEDELRLKKTIHEFEEQNCRLREISWLQSHVVRAPLARVMGLAELLGYDEQDIAKKELIDCLKESANELDQIIWEIIKKSERL